MDRAVNKTLPEDHWESIDIVWIHDPVVESDRNMTTRMATLISSALNCTVRFKLNQDIVSVSRDMIVTTVTSDGSVKKEIA